MLECHEESCTGLKLLRQPSFIITSCDKHWFVALTISVIVMSLDKNCLWLHWLGNSQSNTAAPLFRIQTMEGITVQIVVAHHSAVRALSCRLVSCIISAVRDPLLCVFLKPVYCVEQPSCLLFFRLFWSQSVTLALKISLMSCALPLWETCLRYMSKVTTHSSLPNSAYTWHRTLGIVALLAMKTSVTCLQHIWILSTEHLHSN